MHDTTDNALVEISLALAMAFFALLVVALVSIAAPAREDIEAVGSPRAAVEEIGLAAELGEDRSNEGAAPRILLHHRSRWFDIRGAVVDPALLAADQRRLVVALSPGLTLAEAREVQKAVRHLDRTPTLTTLTRAWLGRLEAGR